MLDILLDYVAVLLIVNDLVEDVFDVFETFDSSTSGEISGLKQPDIIKTYDFELGVVELFGANKLFS